MIEDNIVIVLDTSNYKASYSEDEPFKAKVIDKYDICVVVESLATGKQYELYYFQILELLEIEQIKKIVNVDNLGPPEY